MTDTETITAKLDAIEKRADALTQTITWIPVTERLPDPFTAPLMLAFCGFVDFGGMREPGDFHFLTSRMESCGSVTHWAEPLKHPSEL